MSDPTANLHDSFFKKVMSESELAGTFLREHLPRSLVDLLAPEPPEQVSGSFVDEELAQHHSDLLLRVRLNTGEDALAYLLLEHKSAPDPVARLQLLRYITRILVKWYKEHEVLPLPPVIPILAHQGPNGWKISTEFGDLFGAVPDALGPYLVRFRHALIDLAGIEDSALSGHLRLRAFLKALKYVQREDLPGHFRLLLLDSSALTVEDVVAILTYIGRGPVAVSDEIVQNAVHRLEPGRAEEIMASFGQAYFERGLAEGEARGRAQGEAEGQVKGQVKGEAKALIRLLEKRFGPVPPRLQQRVSVADLWSIEAWFDRAIQALDLQSVFGPDGLS